VPPAPSERWRRLKDVFVAAAEAPPGERERLVERACGDDAALAAEVNALLAAHARDEDFVERIVAGEARELVADAASFAGRRIGAYEVVREIGSGGMGTVFLARRADAAYRAEVALKIVRPGLFSEEALRRFRAERQALASLAHPGIARLLDGGATDDGVPFFVMEHVEGRPIDAYCAEEGLALPERIRLFRSVCAAVQFAHANLIVHRDLKPANILVTASGEAKLLDFGIAKFLGEDDPGRTRAGERVLTPDYASPEQIRGEPVTTATDVYSLGVVLYRLLTGRAPYSFPSGRSSDVERVVAEREPEPPALGGDLDTILRKALAKEPERRYASVVELSEDLRRFLDDEPVAARPDNLGYRASKFLRRHRAGAAATFAVIAALSAGLAVALASAATARREARKAEQINAFVQEVLGAANPWKDGSQITVAEVLDRASGRIAGDLAGQPEVEAGVRRTVGETYSGLGMYDKAERELRRALELLRATRGTAGDDVANALLALSTVLVSRGAPKEAEAPAREALAIRQRLHGSDDASVGEALTALGGVLQAAGELDRAEEAERRAITILRRGGPDASLAEALNNLAVTLGTKGDLAAAEPLQREALATIRRAHPGSHPDVASAMSALASTVWERNANFTEAEALYRDTLAMRRELLGSDHPDVSWTLYNYAYMVMERGDLARAEDLAREGLAHRGTTLPDEHPMVAATLQVVGRCRLGRSDPSGAEPYLRESLALRERTLPPDHWLLAASRSILGESLALQGRIDEARPLLSESYAAMKEKLGPDNPRVREAAQRLAKLPPS
jgi:tetratricopeptide (TPR) repeat protein